MVGMVQNIGFFCVFVWIEMVVILVMACTIDAFGHKNAGILHTIVEKLGYYNCPKIDILYAPKRVS